MPLATAFVGLASGLTSLFSSIIGGNKKKKQQMYYEHQLLIAKQHSAYMDYISQLRFQTILKQFVIPFAVLGLLLYLIHKL